MKTGFGCQAASDARCAPSYQLQRGQESGRGEGGKSEVVENYVLCEECCGSEAPPGVRLVVRFGSYVEEGR